MSAVDHPKHYNSNPGRCSCGAGVECITVVEHMTFNVGNAVKYCWRAGLKGEGEGSIDSKKLEDLKKARWYLDREIARLEAEHVEKELGVKP